MKWLMDFHFECDANVNSHSFTQNSHRSISFRFVSFRSVRFVTIGSIIVCFCHNSYSISFLCLYAAYSPKLQNKLPLTNASPWSFWMVWTVQRNIYYLKSIVHRPIERFLLDLNWMGIHIIHIVSVLRGLLNGSSTKYFYDMHAAPTCKSRIWREKKPNKMRQMEKIY